MITRHKNHSQGYTSNKLRIPRASSAGFYGVPYFNAKRFLFLCCSKVFVRNKLQQGVDIYRKTINDEVV